jgi:hypothetical protein
MQVICHSHSARESGIYAWQCGEYMRNIGGHLQNAIEKRDGMRSCLNRNGRAIAVGNG